MSFKEWLAEVDRLVAEDLPGKRAKDLAAFPARQMWRDGMRPDVLSHQLVVMFRKSGAG